LNHGGAVVLGPTMKFPITRDRLQAFDSKEDEDERKEEEIQKRLALILEGLCKEFERCMSSNIREKKFIWRNIGQIKQMSPGSSIGDMEKALYLPRFVEKLKETFVGCDIIIDPLKTYIIIDWS
jgi:hypothetical protein